MKIKHQLSLATLLLAGVFVTGCSQQEASGGSQSQVEGGSQQQVESAPVVAAPIAAPRVEPAPAPAPAPARPAPVNRWGHTHPAIPRCTKSIRHTHKYTQAHHTHKYGCQQRRAAVRPQPKQEVDVYALQRKLKAKGYYRGPIDGIVGPGTRSALQRFMKR